MKQLQISLFGRFSARYGEDDIAGLKLTKVQELFSYLLLHRGQPQSREVLASLLWGDYHTTAQSKKYLRNALWRLRTALSKHMGSISDRMLEIDPDWIELRSIDELWLDAALFEAAYAAVEDTPCCDLTEAVARKLATGVQLYRGNLLGSWYQEWCLYERERFLQIYLLMLDKLMGYCETTREYEKGLSYGERILQHDRARECTHRQMMRLYALAGNRTGALRQYERCAAALREELDIEPAKATHLLREKVRADQLYHSPVPAIDETRARPDLRGLVLRLRQLETNLIQLRQQVQRATDAAELTLINRAARPDTLDESESQ